MQYRSFTQKDLINIKNLQPEGWPDLLTEFQFYLNQDFCFPVKVEKDNLIIGLGASIYFKNSCWLAHIIVDKKYRNQGIGYFIVEKLIKHAKKLEIETILLLATELGLPVYKKIGFKSVSTYQFFERKIAKPDNSYSKNILPFQDKFNSILFNLDKKISGEDRINLLQLYIKNSYLYIEQNKLLGYYIPGLGEGFIGAENEKAGIELLKFKYNKGNKAVLPEENITAISFLKQNGFKLSDKKGTRMVYGKEIQWKPDKIFSRISGNFG